MPQAPGAEDNASGVAVLLELARMAAAGGTARPVTFVAFGAEEPRGPGDDGHHYGSRVHVGRGSTPRAEVVSLDRVGAPGRVPVCTGGLSPLRVRRELLAAADRLGVPARACENRTSDHWPFERAGRTVARVGGNDYAGYHSAQDLPRVVSRRQLDRVGRRSGSGCGRPDASGRRGQRAWVPRSGGPLARHTSSRIAVPRPRAPRAARSRAR